MKRPNNFLLFSLFLLLVCGAAFVFRDLLLAPIAERLIARMIVAESGLEVAVEKISGSYFRDLKLTGLRTVKPAERGMLVEIEAAMAHVHYSLPLLLQGLDVFFGGIRLELDGVRVDMDFSRAEVESDGEGSSPGSTLVLPVTRVRNSSVNLRGRNWSLSLSEVDLAVAPFDDRLGGIPLTIHAGQSVVELPLLRRQTPKLAARGILSRDSLRIDGLAVNGRPAVEAARFDYGPDEPFRATVSFAAFGGTGKIEINSPADYTALDWEIREVDVSAVAALLDMQGPFPGGIATGNGRVRGDLAEPFALIGAINLGVTDGRIRDIPFERLALAGSFADGIMLIDSLEAAAGGNFLSASGVSASLTALVSGGREEAVETLRGRFEARLEDIPALLTLTGIQLPGGDPPGEIPAHRLVVAGRATEAGIVLESGVFSTAGALVDLEHFAINRPGTGPLPAGLSLSAGLAADISDLGGIAAIFGVEAVGGEFRATIACDGPLDELRGDIELRGRDLRYRTIGVDTLFLKARTEADGWRIVNLAAVNGDDRLTGSGGIAMAPLHFKELVLDLTLRDFHPYLSWFLTGAVPAAHGELAGQLVLSGSPAAPAGDFRVVLTDAGINGLSISRGELLGGMAGETVEVTKLRVRTSAGEVELAGALEHRAFRAPLTGTIDRLTLTREGLSMQLSAPAAFRLDGLDSWSFEEAALQSEAGSFRMAGGFFPAVGYDFSFRLSEAASAPLRPLFPDLPVEFGGLNLTGTVRGPLPTPEVALKGSVAELRASDALVPLAGQFDLLLSARGLVLKTFSWTTAAGERLVLAGTIPYDPYARRLLPTELKVDGLFALSDLETFTAFLPEAFRVPGRLNGKLSISGSGERPEARIDFHAEGVGFPVSFPVHPPGPISVAAAVVLRDNDLHLDSFTVSGDDLGFTLAGIWHQAGDLLQRGRAADGLPGRLDLRGSFSAGEISWLARGFPAIRRLGGRVEGALALSGPAAIPDLVAELSLADGEFRADGALPPLHNLQVQLGFAQRTATVERFSGSIGGAPFTVTGRVLLPAAEEPMADLRVQGANLLLYRSEAVGVRGDADITIRGSFAAPVFAGTFAITDGGLRKNINWLEPLRGIGRSRTPVAGPAGPGGLGLSFRNPPMKDATFAIHVTSKNPFRIKSNVARGNLRPDLWLRGTGEIPLLTGVIYIDRSRIMLPAGKLLVEAGLIRFAEDSPGRPLLEISGSSLILGYEINLTVEGSYDEPTVALSSMPPLPQDALLLLLLTGRLPPGVSDRSRSWQEGMRVALYVGKGVLADWFGGNELDSDESLLDRFDVVVGRGISRQGNETIGAQYRLADSVMRDGDELYLVAERDVYDEFNTGVRIVFRFK